MRLTRQRIHQLPLKATIYLVRDGGASSLVVQVFPQGRKVYQVRVRIGDKIKTRTLGTVDQLTLTVARQQAQQQVTEWQQVNGDIHRSPTLAVFMAGEWKTHVYDHWKPSTQYTATHYMKNQLLPALGGYALVNLTYPVVNAWFETYSQTTKGGANRALDVLKTAFTLALRLVYCRHDPCRLIVRNPKKRFNRFLSDNELKTVGEVLHTLAESRPNYYQQANIVRMLLLTGCRVSEILTLQWSMIKPNTIDLPDSKTGARSVYLSEDAKSLLRCQPTVNEWVFPTLKTGKPYHNITGFWHKVRALANVPDMRVHDLRHTFASHAALQGNSVPMIAKMLGHAQLTMTLRYAHVHEHDIMMAAERIGTVYESILRTGKSSNKAVMIVPTQKRVSRILKPLKIRFTETEITALTPLSQGVSLEYWLLEHLKLAVILDKALDSRERLYRVRARHDRYKQKHYGHDVVLMLTPEEYTYLNGAATHSQLWLSAWSRVKALDIVYGK